MYVVYFLAFYVQNYSDCMLGCQNIGDLHSIVCLNASCEDTEKALNLLLLLFL